MNTKYSRIILFFLTFSLLVNTSFYFTNPNILASAETVTVGAVGANYTSFFDAVNNTSSGDTIYVWEGIYDLEVVSVNFPRTIIGNGTDKTIFDGDGYGIPLWWGMLGPGINITDIGFINCTTGLIFENANNFNISNCTFTNCTDNSINISSTTGGNIYNCTFTDTGIAGYDSEYINISNCTFTNTTYGFETDTEQEPTGLIIDLNINNCTFTNCTTGVSISADGEVSSNDYNNISYNIFNDCIIGINFTKNDYSWITNNTITNCTTGIYQNNCDYINISNNFIRYNTLGLNIISGGTSTVYNNYFNNTANIQATGSLHTFNISKTTGSNIVNGINLGGNYWHDYTGEDADGDNIGDTSFNIYGSFYDYLPLVDPGLLSIYVYDETNCSQSLVFDILVSSKNASATPPPYELTGVDGYMSIPVALCPTGDDVIILISADGYNQRVYYVDLDVNTNYNLKIYLPPKVGTGEEPDCSLQVYVDSIAVTNPAVDAVVSLSQSLEQTYTVEIYNESLYTTYGGWIEVSASDYSYTSSQVTIDNSVLDENITMAKVAYYFRYCPSQLGSYLYQLQVTDKYNSPIADVEIIVKKYINCTGIFEDTSRFFTDDAGNYGVYLIPSVLYKFYLAKTGYVSATVDFIPTKNVFTVPIKLSIDYPSVTNYDNFSLIIDGAVVAANNSLNVSYLDTNSTTFNVSINVYEVYNGTWVLNATYNSSTSNSFFFFVEDINTSRSHILEVYYNNTAIFMGTYNSPLYYTIWPDDYGLDAADVDYESRFIAIFGENPLGWTNTFSVALAITFLITLGPFNVGAGMFAAGLSIGFIQAVLGIGSVLLVALCPVLIFISILYFFTKGEGEMNL